MTIQEIKRHSRRKGKSVSRIIEEFIDNLDKHEAKEKLDITKIIGAFGKAPKNFDADKIRWEYLKEKHGL